MQSKREQLMHSKREHRLQRIYSLTQFPIEGESATNTLGRTLYSDLCQLVEAGMDAVAEAPIEDLPESLPKTGVVRRRLEDLAPGPTVFDDLIQGCQRCIEALEDSDLDADQASYRVGMECLKMLFQCSQRCQENPDFMLSHLLSTTLRIVMQLMQKSSLPEDLHEPHDLADRTLQKFRNLLTERLASRLHLDIDDEPSDDEAEAEAGGGEG